MYQKTANLLTGETEATLEEQAKVAEGIKQVSSLMPYVF
jgi:hypothetical protein